ncbi:MAG TPA: prolipoprotein diacylglyceryl transferase [Streptosporangiaceae bacterium]
MVSHAAGMPLSFLPSPPDNGFHVGPLFVHFYGLMYVVGIALAIYITRRRWLAAGGDPSLVADVATWAVPAGIIGGRIYFDITTPADIPPHWWGVFAVWSGGLGIWGGIAAGAAAGVWRVRRTGASAAVFANAIAPALLVAQAVGRIGNYFNQELFGKPSTLPWALEISQPHRPAGYGAFATFQPTFLYELVWDLALAAFLVWLGHHRRIRPPGLFALYVAGYSAFRIFEEFLRIDSSEHFLGLRLNFYVASAGVLAGLAWFVLSQRRTGPFPAAMPPSAGAGEPGSASAADSPDEADGDGAGDGGADDAADGPDPGETAGRGRGEDGQQPGAGGGASAISARAAEQ